MDVQSKYMTKSRYIQIAFSLKLSVHLQGRQAIKKQWFGVFSTEPEFSDV